MSSGCSFCHKLDPPSPKLVKTTFAKYLLEGQAAISCSAEGLNLKPPGSR